MKSAGAIFILLIMTGSIIPIVKADTHKPVTITTSGEVIYIPNIEVMVNSGKNIGKNNLSLGFQLDWHRWKTFIDSEIQNDLAVEAGFKLIRLFDFRKTNPILMPCTYWNETTKTGTWDWTNVDATVAKVFEVGAEPLFTLGWARDNIKNYIPAGMTVDIQTNLPYPASYAAYAAEWVKHFRNIGLPVRYYQIMNEPHFYFGWNPSNTTLLANYVALWNAATKSMRQENLNILISNDAITMKRVFDYWLAHGEDIDYLDFHKYDAEEINQFSDSEMFNRAEQRIFETSTTFYGVTEARQKYFNTRGKWLQTISSEGNFNSAWETGTDPKIQQITGAVWLALVLRTGILKGINYNIYFEFCSSKSWQQAHGTGWGFGMINEDNNMPWYPYYVNKMIGSNLAVGDRLIETESSSNDVRSIAWINEGKLNIILICKTTESRTITIQGVSGPISLFRIDNMVSYETPYIQNSTTDASERIWINGYTVALLQLPAS